MARRNRGQSRTVPVSELRDVVQKNDPRHWAGVAVVKKLSSDGPVYILKDDQGNPRDVMVECSLMPEEIPLTARIGTSGGSAGGWVGKLPKAGDEVVVVFPHGQVDGDPVLVGNLSTGQLPSALDTTTMVFQNTDGDVRVISGGTQVHLTKDGNVDITTPSGKTVNLNGTDYSGIQFDGKFETDLANVMTDLLAGTVGGPSAQNLKVTGDIVTMLANLQSGAYRSTKVKLG